jgi:Mg/Co/Ni transporter MgtE
MKDHRKAEIVNEITALAQRYAGTQQLREHMRGAILQYLKEQKRHTLNACAKIADEEAEKWVDSEAIGACRNISVAINSMKDA